MNAKRLLCCAMALVFLFVGSGLTSLAAGDIVAEPYRFVQRAKGQAPDASLPARLLPSDAVRLTRAQGADSVGWAFAAVAALEASGLKQGQIGPAATFSENHMRYATSSDSGNTAGFARGYTAAGSRRMATAYWMRGDFSGPVYTASDPYVAGAGAPARPLSETASRDRDIRVTGVIYIPDPPDTQEGRALALSRIKRHVQSYGAVSVALHFEEAELLGDSYRYVGGGEADTAVALIGWDDATAHAGGTGAFLAKDSREGGRLIWISYDTPLTDAYAVQGVSSKLFDRTYEHDIFGLSGTLGFRAATAWSANLFTAAGPSEALTAISFFATGEDTTVEFYAAPVQADAAGALTKAAGGTPLTLEDGATKAFFELPGYYTVQLKTPLALVGKGETFAVVAKATTAFDTEPIPLQSGVTGAQTGKSFASADGAAWLDTAANNNATVCLKAHVSQDVDIPLTAIRLAADGQEGAATDGEALMINTGRTVTLGPELTPLNANNLERVEWYVGDAYGSSGSFVKVAELQIDQAGASTVTPDTRADPSVRIEAADGKLTGLREDDLSLRARAYTRATTGVMPASAGVFESTLRVQVRDVLAASVTLSTEQETITTDQTITLEATVSPSEATHRDLVWFVARDEFGTLYPQEEDPDDPFGSGRPVVRVSGGVVTPIRPGECYVFAETADGGARASCKITVLEIPAVGVALNASRVTMSVGTQLTLGAVTRPANASYWDMVWTSGDPSVAEVDERGIVYARAKGETTVTATDRAGHTASCAVEVSLSPSAVIPLDKSRTFSVLGHTEAREDILWELSSMGGKFATRQSGARLRVTADTVGGALLTALVRVNRGTEEEPDYRITARQSWRLDGVVKLTKLKLVDEAGVKQSKVTLCADADNLLESETMIVRAQAERPDDATVLGYEWSSLDESVATVEMVGSRGGATAVIRAVSPGTTRITALNHNGDKRASIKVKVLMFPQEIQMKSPPLITLEVGRKTRVDAVIAKQKGVDSTVMITVADAGVNERPHTDEDPIAVAGPRGKITAVRSGVVTVTAWGKPFEGDAPRAVCEITCVQPVKRVSVRLGVKELAVGEGTLVDVDFSPTAPDNASFTYTISNADVASVRALEDGTLVVEGLAPGKATLTVVTDDGGKKATAVIKVRSP